MGRGLTGTGWFEVDHYIILIGTTTNTTKEGHAGQEQYVPLEILRKGGINDNVAFLHGALQLLVAGIMDAEVSATIGTQHEAVSDDWNQAKLFPMLYLPLVKPRAP